MLHAVDGVQHPEQQQRYMTGCTLGGYPGRVPLPSVPQTSVFGTPVLGLRSSVLGPRQCPDSDLGPRTSSSDTVSPVPGSK